MLDRSKLLKTRRNLQSSVLLLHLAPRRSICPLFNLSGPRIFWLGEHHGFTDRLWGNLRVIHFKVRLVRICWCLRKELAALLSVLATLFALLLVGGTVKKFRID